MFAENISLISQLFVGMSQEISGNQWIHHSDVGGIGGMKILFFVKWAGKVPEEEHKHSYHE
jgi:hypothetical protein